MQSKFSEKIKEFLKRLRITDDVVIVLPMSKADFVSRLIEITRNGEIGMMSDFFDVTSSGNHEFKGQVNDNGFKIKRRRRVFDRNISTSVANGVFVENNGHLTINTEINGFNGVIVVYYVLLILVYPVIVFFLFIGPETSKFVDMPFLLIHWGLMFGLPYFIIRRSVKQLKYELEREFFYLTKSMEIQKQI